MSALHTLGISRTAWTWERNIQKKTRKSQTELTHLPQDELRVHISCNVGYHEYLRVQTGEKGYTLNAITTAKLHGVRSGTRALLEPRTETG